MISGRDFLCNGKKSEGGQSVRSPVGARHANCYVWSLVEHLQGEGGIHLSTCFSHNLVLLPHNDILLTNGFGEL